ncbi:O-antigen ligase family protein [Patescibacteria group bacterium]|nr:O-antigen ligase family protein [Patescibacteria group bacterium]
MISWIQSKPLWVKWVFAIIALEVISLATVFVPEARAIATILAGGIMALVAIRRPEIGLAALLAELAIGSKGALLKIPEGAEVDGGTSLRIVLTFAFLVGWFVNYLQSKPRWKEIRSFPKERWAWIALGGIVFWGTVRGATLHNAFFMSDANAWVYLILLVPVVDIATRNREKLIEQGWAALAAALLWLPIKTLALLYVWSHTIKSLSHPLYLWVRRTGVGEVTLVTGNLFRVFIQSQIYALVGFFGILLAPKDFFWSALGKWLIIGSAVSLMIGLSRSLWIGLAFGGLVLLGLVWKTQGKKEILPVFGRGIFAVLVAGIIIGQLISFPLPRIEAGSLKTLFGSRVGTGDAAAESRWNLLPILVNKIKEAPILGSGFGASVTYASKDPRILAQNPNGMYTTYAFEWGWLEHWIKFGILGIPIMLWVLISLGRRVWISEAPLNFRIAFVATFVGLAALHVFTPYLNHPLGFGVLLAGEALATAAKKVRT